MSELPTWVQVAGTLNLTTAFVALAAAAVALGAYFQRREADAREHWWDRTRWAVERAQDPSPHVREIGLEVLVLQARSRLAGKEELTLLAAIQEPILAELRERLAGDVRDREPVNAESLPAASATRTDVAAARLRVVTDRGLGRATPDWVVRLAETEKP